MTQAQTPSHAEQGLTLLARHKHAVLASLSHEDGQTPYASLVQYALSARRGPLFLLSDLAEHTRNLKAHPRASLLVAEEPQGADPLTLARATLVGQLRRCAEETLVEDRACMLARHPDSARYIDFGDFHLYELEVEKVRFVGGFGRMSWVRGSAWAQASPDPLWEAAPGIILHMNEDHADAMVLYCRSFGQAPETQRARLLSVDQYGMDILAEGAEGPGQALRIGFEAPVGGAGALRRALVKMAKEAREALGLEAP